MLAEAIEIMQCLWKLGSVSRGNRDHAVLAEAIEIR